MKRLFFIPFLVGLAGYVQAQPRASEESERRPSNAAAETRVSVTPEETVKPGECTSRPIPFDSGAGKTVVRIDIHETIDLGLSPFVARVLEEAQEQGAALVLLHMHTPGGRLDAAQNIKDALLKSKVPTATFIDTNALSAGALIAYATDFIIVTEGSTMGAATPINISQGGEAQPVGEKFVSAVRAIFRATAEAKNRDGTIAESMVDKDVPVFGLVGNDKLLTLTKTEALEWCVADHEAADVKGVLEVLNLSGAVIEHRTLNWAEKIARILTDPMVSSMLMSFGFLGLMLELYTAGFGLAGIVGLTCLFLFFLGHLVVDLVGLEEIILFVVGAGLLFVEIFVIPGFGLAGVAGILCLGASVVLSLVGSDLSFSWDIGVLPDALARVGIAMLLTIGFFAIAAKFLPDSKLLGRLVLQGAVQGQSFDAPAPQAPSLVGQTGVAVTPVRGSGKARIGGQTLDVVNEGRAIDKGDPVVVVESRPGRVVVAPKETA